MDKVEKIFNEQTIQTIRKKIEKYRYNTNKFIYYSKQVVDIIRTPIVFKKCYKIYKNILDNKNINFTTENYMMPSNVPAILYHCGLPSEGQQFFVSTESFVKEYNKRYFSNSKQVVAIPSNFVEVLEYAEFGFFMENRKNDSTTWNKHYSNTNRSAKHFRKLDVILHPWIKKINDLCQKDQLFKNIWYYHWVYRKNKGTFWSPVWLVELKKPLIKQQNKNSSAINMRR